MLRGLSILLLLVLIQQSWTSTDQKINRLDKLIEEARVNPVIQFNEDKIRSHSSAKHNYSIFLLFSTRNPQVGCKYCPETEQQFKILAQGYQDWLNPGGYSSETFLEHPTFFAQVDVLDAKELFLSAGFQNIPKIVHIPPREAKGSFEPSLWSSYDDSSFAKDLTAETMAKWVAHEIKQSFTIPTPLSVYLNYIGGGLVSLFILLKYVIPEVISSAKKPMFWYSLSLGMFCFTMAGVVYNAINNPPWSHFNPQTMTYMFIYPSARVQFVLEGILMSALLVTTSLFLVALGAWVPTIKNVYKRTSMFFALYTASVICFIFVFNAFKIKYPWYSL